MNPRKQKVMAPHAPVINNHLKSEASITLRCQLRSTGYTALRIKNYSKSTCSHFRCEGKPSRSTAKSTLFAASKDEWDTKEDTGKSMKNELYVLRYAKRYLSAEAMSNNEKSSP